MKAVSTRMEGIGDFQHRKARLLDASLVQGVHTSQLPKHGASELEAVVDLAVRLRSLRVISR